NKGVVAKGYGHTGVHNLCITPHCIFDGARGCGSGNQGIIARMDDGTTSNKEKVKCIALERIFHRAAAAVAAADQSGVAALRGARHYARISGEKIFHSAVAERGSVSADQKIVAAVGGAKHPRAIANKSIYYESVAAAAVVPTDQSVIAAVGVVKHVSGVA